MSENSLAPYRQQILDAGGEGLVITKTDGIYHVYSRLKDGDTGEHLGYGSTKYHALRAALEERSIVVEVRVDDGEIN